MTDDELNAEIDAAITRAEEVRLARMRQQWRNREAWIKELIARNDQPPVTSAKSR